MKYRLLKALCLFCLAGLVVAGAAQAAEVINRVEAVVGDDVITALDVDRMVKNMLPPETASGAEAKTAGQKLRGTALERLIEDKLFDQEVKRLQLNVSDQEIERYLGRIKQANQVSDEQFLAQLSRRGLTVKEYRQQLQRDILKHKLIAKEVQRSVVISDDQVEDYYKKNISQYKDLHKVHLRAIFLGVPEDATPARKDAVRQRAEELRSEAREKKNFAELASKYSEGPGAEKGGDLGALTASDLFPAMRQAVAELKPGEISPVIDMPRGYVFLQMVERKGSATTPLDEVRKEIRVKLEKEALDAKFQQWMKDLRAKTYVKIVGP